MAVYYRRAGRLITGFAVGQNIQTRSDAINK